MPSTGMQSPVVTLMRPSAPWEGELDKAQMSGSGSQEQARGLRTGLGTQAQLRGLWLGEGV